MVLVDVQIVIGGDVIGGGSMHPTACGISLTSHEYPGENVKGQIKFRNIKISDTAGAGIRMMSKPADASSMWQPAFENITLENCATSWPAPPTPRCEASV